MAININAKTTGVGGLETSADNSGNINIQSGGTTVMSVTSSGVAVTGSFSQNGAVYSTQPTFRNLIINGDMRIDQRNAGSAVTINAASRTYGVDRWLGYGQASDGVFTIVQDTESPAGFVNSTKITTTTADASIGASQYYLLGQSIEGTNFSHLAWGSASAKTVTLSFWVRSSLTGTFGGAINNNVANRSYPFTYTIDSANTWEQKSVTITGDTSGTWITTTGIGANVWFDLGCGSSNVGTAGTWAAAGYYGATGTTSLIGTSGATFYITGVQLEVGTEATPFEHRPYDMELARCQRYYLQYDYTGFYETIFMPTYIGSASSQNIVLYFPVEMRSGPNISHNGAGNFRVNVVSGVQDEVCNSITASNISKFKTRLTFEKATANMTTGQVGYINTQENNDASIYISAEL